MGIRPDETAAQAKENRRCRYFKERAENARPLKPEIEPSGHAESGVDPAGRGYEDGRPDGHSEAPAFGLHGIAFCDYLGLWINLDILQLRPEPAYADVVVVATVAAEHYRNLDLDGVADLQENRVAYRCDIVGEPRESQSGQRESDGLHPQRGDGERSRPVVNERVADYYSV